MRKNQQGASYIAILIAIIGFAFLAKIAIAVWSPYWDDRVVDSQITELRAIFWVIIATFRPPIGAATLA